MYDLLKLLETNARYSDDELAAMLGCTADEVRAQIAKYKKDGIICGFKTIINWEQTDRDYVVARIELRVTPKKDHGFEELAEQISQYDEVQSLFLMSGGYDLAVTVVGKSFRDIASFVAYRLSPIEAVQSTATHFVLRKYKERSCIFVDTKKDQRGVM
jgi:Transcriptional regulators